MSEFTVKRRSFLLAALLAPLARPLAALGIEPNRGSEFTIGLQGSDDKWIIRLTEDGDVEEVTYSNGQRTFPMQEVPHGIGFYLEKDSWRGFQCCDGRIFAQIRFRVIDANTIQVDYVVAQETMEPFTAVKDSNAEPQVEIEWFGGSMEKMGSL